VGFEVDRAALEQVFSEYNRPVVSLVIVDSVPLHTRRERKKR
jgi:hypothetical protein